MRAGVCAAVAPARAWGTFRWRRSDGPPRARADHAPRRGAAGDTPRDRANLAGLEQDVRDSPLKGWALPLRLRNFRPDTGSYLASLGGPRPYMARLREIATLTAAHQQALAESYAVFGGDRPPGPPSQRDGISTT